MSERRLCFVDASILIISAARKPTAETLARRMRAHQTLNDKTREFVASDFLKLETIPMAKFFIKKRELRFYNDFFQSISKWAPCDALIVPAFELASEFGLGAMVALHICAAKHFGAEFNSAEKPTKPIYRAYSNISSIY